MTDSELEARVRVTTDPTEIRTWVTQRRGVPSALVDARGMEGGVLYILYPESTPDERRRYQPISWGRFFREFEENHLAFLYQDYPGSRHGRIISQESIAQEGEHVGSRYDATA